MEKKKILIPFNKKNINVPFKYYYLISFFTKKGIKLIKEKGENPYVSSHNANELLDFIAKNPSCLKWNMF
jgi:hypothetical protein